MAVRVACPCGQGFTVHPAHGPATVSCHMCGHKMLVDVCGGRVHLSWTEEENPNDQARGPGPTAIFEKSTVAASAIQPPVQWAPENDVAAASEPLERDAVEEALKRIELDWQIERLKYPLHRTEGESWLSQAATAVFWWSIFSIIITCPLWAIIEKPFGGGWFTLAAFSTVEVCAAIGASVVLQHRRRAEHDAALAAYQGKRRAALGRLIRQRGEP
jgi:hypothetical protein